MTDLVCAVLYLGRDLLKIACLLFVTRHILAFPQKKRRSLFAALFLLLMANAAAAVYWIGPAEEDRRALTDVFSFLLCAAFPVASAKKPCAKALLSFAAALLLDFTADTLYSLLADVGRDRLLFETVFGAAFYGLLFGFLHYAEKKRDVSFLRGAFSSVPKWAWAALLFFEFTCYYRTFGEALSWYRVFAAVSAVSVLFTLFFLIFRLLYFAEQQSRILRQLALQREYGESLLQSDEELRAFRHDYRNHMLVINAYLENGNLRAAKTYVNGISQLASAGMRRVSAGCFAADAVLGYAMDNAEKQGVRIDFQGRIPEGLLRDEDLCAILSNLLDNAVDAAAASADEKIVHIDAVCKNGFFLLCVSNPVGKSCGADGADGTLPKTTKADKINHGYGLRNVKKTVEKYDGSFRVERGTDAFTAEVRLTL